MRFWRRLLSGDGLRASYAAAIEKLGTSGCNYGMYITEDAPDFNPSVSAE
eukprot:m.50095 g.50095  ORF g.50095 m.50095 type:complete len:50 (+) comp6517_c0_seq1:680-829(+)